MLFAENGYTGLSMRMLANAADLSVAALYHHFPDKHSLYLATMHFAFADKAQVFAQIWQSSASPAEQLAQFVRSLLISTQQDPHFHRLMQREIMSADPERMQLLATGVFKEQFLHLQHCVAQLAPHLNAHLAATSVIGLVKNHLDFQPLHRHFPGWEDRFEQTDTLAEHITSMLLNGLAARSNQP